VAPFSDGDNQHYSHSREFRSNITAEQKFWKQVLSVIHSTQQ